MASIAALDQNPAQLPRHIDAAPMPGLWSRILPAHVVPLNDDEAVRVVLVRPKLNI
jgi:hypothetical protein